MALINEIIPVQGFEVVLNKIASILLIEVSNQISIQGITDVVEVYTERMAPFDKSEDVIINVSCNSANYENMNQRDVQASTDYFIDVYTRGFDDNVEDGEENSRHKLHRYIGMCRYILSSVKYKTLGFDMSLRLVGGSYVNSINFDDNYGNQDAAYVRMARLTLSVRVQENQQMDDVVEFLGNDTTTKLSNTDKGQKLIFNT